jgi:hypothetical protein
METPRKLAPMKILTSVVGCLLLAILVSAECVVVEPVYHPSSEKARVTVLLDGKPLKDAKLEFSPVTENKSRVSLSTDRHGVASAPELLPGRYRVVAAGLDKLTTELYLHVSKSSRNQPTVFVMNLATPPAWTPPVGAAWEAAEKAPVTELVREFGGLLLDPSGASISGAETQVLRKDSQPAVVGKLKSDEAGRFATRLADGTYVAFIQMPGLRTQVLAFDVARTAGPKQLRIPMQTGSSC